MFFHTPGVRAHAPMHPPLFPFSFLVNDDIVHLVPKAGSLSVTLTPPVPTLAPSPGLTGCAQARLSPVPFGVGCTSVGIPAHGSVVSVGELGAHLCFCLLWSEENKARVPEWVWEPREVTCGRASHESLLSGAALGAPCPLTLQGDRGQADGLWPSCPRGHLALGAWCLPTGDCEGSLGGSSVTTCQLALGLSLPNDCVSFCVLCSPASWAASRGSHTSEGSLRSGFLVPHGIPLWSEASSCPQFHVVPGCGRLYLSSFPEEAGLLPPGRAPPTPLGGPVFSGVLS